MASDNETISLEEIDKSIEFQLHNSYQNNALSYSNNGNVNENALSSLFEYPLREAREMFEKAYLEEKLIELGGSVGKVAQIAGVERTHLYRKMKTLGIDAKKIAKKTKK